MADLSLYRNIPDGTSISIFAANEGVWANALCVLLDNFTTDTYEIKVLKKSGVYLEELESWTVSHTFKTDPYGKQMHAEDVINGQSDYIQVVINTHTSAPALPLHKVSGVAVADSGEIQKIATSAGNFKIIPKTVKVTVTTAGNFTLVDDGAGKLSGVGGTGTIDYETGEYSISYTFGSSGTIAYKYSSLLQLADGLDGDVAESDDYVKALELFSTKRDLDFEFFVEPSFLGTDFQQALCDMLEARGDSIAFLNTPSGLSAVDLAAWMNESAVRSKVAVYCAPNLLQRDPASGALIEVSPTAAMSAAYTYRTRAIGPYYPVAGFDHGQISCIGTAKTFTDVELALLLESKLNVIIPDWRSGAVVLEQRTTGSEGGIYSHVHVVRLLGFVSRIVIPFLRTLIGKVGTQALWRHVYHKISAALTTVQEQGGLQAFSVTCDISNNRPSSEELYVDLVLVPSEFSTKIEVYFKTTDDVEIKIV